MKLYDCATAPSPRRVRMYVAEKGIDVDSQEVDLRNGEHLKPAFRELNPDCTVPVLELDDGTCLSEVIAICQYLEEMNPQPLMMGDNPAERARVLMWNAKVEMHGLAAIAEMFRNKASGFKNRALTGPHTFEQIPNLVNRGQRRIELFFDRLNDQLADTRYLAGDKFTLADITGFVAVEFASWNKLSIGDHHSHLQRWHDEVKGRPSARS